MWVEAYGPDVIRVRRSMTPRMPDRQEALLEPLDAAPVIEVGEKGASMVAGSIKAVVDEVGKVAFYRLDGKEEKLHCAEEAQDYRSLDSDLYQISADFRAFEDERIYGLGQYQHGKLNQKGCVLDLIQLNRQIAIPCFVSSRGYGFIWHNPALGRVELAENRTRWVAESAPGIDYLITTGDDYAGIMKKYADVTGYPLEMPEWATGFWQSKLRYKTQEELLEVAREYKRRGIPLSVIVLDFFHWTMLGDFKFDPKCFPDPKAMVDELTEMGVKLMTSVWPMVNRNSINYEEIDDLDLMLRNERGLSAQHDFIDTFPPGKVVTQYFDSTNPETQAYVWKKIKETYYDIGVRLFWLDQIEPEIFPAHFEDIRFHLGNGKEVACVYPLLHEKGFYDGLKGEGEEEILTLCRSAWLGSQRYGSLVWSGDINPTFDVLSKQIQAGLNMAMCGIPWWNSDIGGFYEDDPASEYYREIVIRWFQFGTFCPVMRLHGVRKPSCWTNVPELTGGPNEVWSYGEKAYDIMTDYIDLRYRLQPYINEQMDHAHKTGTPPMRPLFFDFADDPKTYDVEDCYLFGPDLLVAPVTTKDQRTRSVYLPAGAEWTDPWTETKYEGGQTVEVDAPIERIPLFVKNGAELPIQK